jgi:hypothetical protein
LSASTAIACREIVLTPHEIISSATDGVGISR